MLDKIAVAFWLAFASHASGLPIPPPAPLPTVILVPSLPPGRDGETDLGTGLVRLLNRPRGEADTDCLLAHELTHWLQVQNHQRFACTAAMEPLAYRVTAACFAMLQQPDSARWALRQAAAARCAR